jgi:outer membrane protein assembly factor BamB
MDPTGPNDPLATVLTDQNAGLGNTDSVNHPTLVLNQDYNYAAFVNDGTNNYSPGKFTQGRPFDASGNVKWAYSTGASSLAPPGIGSAYIVSNDNVLHAVNPGPNGGDWPAGFKPLVMGGPSQARPPVVQVAVGAANKVVFVGSQDGNVYAVNADTGGLEWVTIPPIANTVQAGASGMFTPRGAYDLIIVGTRNPFPSANALVGLHVSDGSVAWSFVNSVAQNGDGQPIGLINSGAVVDYSTNRAYFASNRHSTGSNDTVWCVQFTDTSVTRLWSVGIDHVDGAPTLYDNRLYVGNRSGDVYALDPSNATIFWSYPTDPLPPGVNGFLYPLFPLNWLFLSTAGDVWCLSDDGSSASRCPGWNPPVAISTPSIPLYTPKGSDVLVGSGDGNLYVIDVGTAAATPIQLGDGSSLVGSPSLDVLNSIVYVGTADGVVYAVVIP